MILFAAGMVCGAFITVVFALIVEGSRDDIRRRRAQERETHLDSINKFGGW